MVITYDNNNGENMWMHGHVNVLGTLFVDQSKILESTYLQDNEKYGVEIGSDITFYTTQHGNQAAWHVPFVQMGLYDPTTASYKLKPIFWFGATDVNTPHMFMSAPLFPKADNLYSLGKDTAKWSGVYSHKFVVNDQSDVLLSNGTTITQANLLGNYCTKTEVEALQKQIDGEISSWFFEGEPTLSNKPASEWNDETLKQRHEGDIYTNINNATNEHLDNPDIWENGSSTSESGKSYDAVKTNLTTRIRTKELLRNNKSPKKIKVVAGYSVVIRYFDENKIQTTGSSDTWLSEFTLNPNYPYFALAFRKNDNSNITIDVLKSFTQSIFTIEGAFDYDPTAGQSWRWCNVDDEYGTGWNWHKIADSDAVKALQEAGKAQATADGKSTIFSLTGTNKPTNYQKGDMWVLQSDTIHSAGKKGDILNANADSATYAASHWTKEVSYIDESVAQQQAQQALDGLELGTRNLLINSSKYTEKTPKVVSGKATDIILSDTEVKAHLEAGVQYTISAKTDGTWSPKHWIDGTANPNDKLVALWLIKTADEQVGVTYHIQIFNGNSKTFTLDNTGDYYIRFNGYSNGTDTISVNVWDIKVEKGSKATGWSPAPEDVDSKADAIKAIADAAEDKADAAVQNLDDMSNDSILTPQEKGSVANEWACIQNEYTQNTTNATSVGMTSDTAYTTYKGKYDALATYVSGLALSTKSNTTIVQSTFQSKFREYYSANVAFLNALAIKVAELEVAAMEVGGRNLARGTKDMQLSSSNTWSKGTWRKTSYSTNIDLADAPLSMVEQGIRITCRADNSVTQVAQDNATIPFQVGDKLIVSCYAKPSVSGLKLECQPIWAYYNNTSGQAGMNRQQITLGNAGEWQKVVFDKIGSITIANDSQSLAYFYAIGSTTAYIDICAVKVEKGTKATDWTPAPEDIDTAINSKLSLSGGQMTGPISFPTAEAGDQVMLKDGDNGYNLLTYTLQGLSVARNLYPAASNYNLGYSSIPWGNAYLNNLLSVSSINSNDMQPLYINGYDVYITSKNNDVTISGGLELYGEMISNSAIYAPAFYESSDIRKKDVKSDLSLSKCYELIDKCQTIIYSLKDQTQEQVGMIAQEIEEFFPEVVATDKDGFKSLAYDRLVVICFKVLKDVIKRLEKLENAE